MLSKLWNMRIVLRCAGSKLAEFSQEESYAAHIYMINFAALCGFNVTI